MKNIRPVVYQNLSTLLASGVPILRALQTTGKGVRGKWRRTFNEMHDHVSKGNCLAEAMTLHRRMFKPLDVLIVETGEISGNLPQALDLLSEWYGLTDRMRSRIRSGLVYPGFIIHAAAFLLPLPSVILGDVTLNVYLVQVLQTLLYYFYGPVLVIWGIIHLTPSQGILRKILDAMVLMVPGLGRGMRYMAMSRYCRAFSMFISAGVNGVESARKATEVTGNAVVAGYFKGAAESAKEGKPFSQGLSKRLPLMFREQWVVGEETGQLDEMTRPLADSTAETGERNLKEFSRWFPRIIYFGILLVLAYFVLRTALEVYGGVMKEVGI